MTHAKVVFVVALLVVAVAAGGCRTAPIASVADRPFVQDADPSLDDSWRAIQQGAALREWSIEAVGPGEALANSGISVRARSS